MKYTKESLIASIKATDGISFKESGLIRETYNGHLAVVEHAARHFTQGGKAKVKFSFNPMKDDSMKLASTVIPDSVLDQALRAIKAERQKLVLNALENDMLPEDTGLSDKVFADTAKMLGAIPRSFAAITDSGGYKYGKDEIKAWMSYRFNHVMELRQMAGKPTASDEVKAEPKPTKRNKASASA